MRYIILSVYRTEWCYTISYIIQVVIFLINRIQNVFHAQASTPDIGSITTMFQRLLYSIVQDTGVVLHFFPVLRPGCKGVMIHPTHPPLLPNRSTISSQDTPFKKATKYFVQIFDFSLYRPSIYPSVPCSHLHLFTNPINFISCMGLDFT